MTSRQMGLQSRPESISDIYIRQLDMVPKGPQLQPQIQKRQRKDKGRFNGSACKCAVRVADVVCYLRVE